MESTENIKRKVEKPASTKKQEDDGKVMVEYTRKSDKYPLTCRISRHLANLLEKRGIIVIKN